MSDGTESIASAREEMSGRLAQLEDIADRLSKSADLAAALFQSYPDAVVVADGISGDIMLANKQAEFLFGRRIQELQTMKVEDLLPEYLRQRHLQHRQEYMISPGTRPMGVDLDTKILRRDDMEIPVFISLAPVVLPGGMFVTIALRAKAKWGWKSET